MTKKEQTVLMMPLIQEEDSAQTFLYPSSGMGAAVSTVPVTFDALASFAEDFQGYEMDTIEVHVKGVAKTGGLTKLIVGLEGEAGVKITLKKKS